MKILCATHLGMCFGVRDAIALALAEADAGPLTILGKGRRARWLPSWNEPSGLAAGRPLLDVSRRQ